MSYPDPQFVPQMLSPIPQRQTTGGMLKKILFDGGYVMNGESGPVYMFFLRDHLGSVRAMASEK